MKWGSYAGLVISYGALCVVAQDAIVVDTVPKAISEDYIREGYQGGRVSVTIDSPTTHFRLEAVRRYLPVLFSGKEGCQNEGCDQGIANRLQAVLEDTTGGNVNCVCDESCGNSFPGTSCYCGSQGVECQKIRVQFLPDPEYEISIKEKIYITLKPQIFTTPPWGGDQHLAPITITPTAGLLSVVLTKNGSPISHQVTGADLASGTILATLTLTGEVWSPINFTASAFISDKPASKYPVGFEARKKQLLPDDMLWGPTPNILQFTFGKDTAYNIPPGEQEVITICGDQAMTTKFVRSGLGIASGVEITVVAPFASTECTFPVKADCTECVEGWYGADCKSQCPGGGTICSGNGECLATASGRCHGGCSDGIMGTGSCDCLVGWEGSECAGMSAVAIAGTSTAAVAAGSLLLEIAAGGSPAAPITSMTQLQLIVLLGVQPCVPTNIRSLASSITWIVNPWYGAIRAEHDPTDDAKHLFHSYLLLIASMTAHLLVILIVYAVKHRSGWTLTDAMEAVWFPNLQLLITVLLLYNSVFSAAAIVTQGAPNHAAAIIGAIVMLAFYVVGLPAGMYWFLVKQVAPNNPVKRRAQYLSRNVANTRKNASRVVYTRRRAGLMPGALRYFLPMGFWTSHHLPDRGFCGRCGVLFDEFRDKRFNFMILQIVKFVCCAFTLGLKESSKDTTSACKLKLWFLLVFLTVFAIVITYQQPYSARGSNMLHSMIAWCNAACLASIISDIYAGGGSSADKLLLLNTCLLILSALWSMLVFVLGKTVYKVKYTTGRTQNLREMSHFMTGEKTIEEVKKLTDTQASHVGLVSVKTNSQGWRMMWCELRGVFLLRYESAQVDVPEGGTDVSKCRVEYDPKKKKVMVEDTGLPPEGSTFLRSNENEHEALSWLKALSQVSSHAMNSYAEGPVFSHKAVTTYCELNHLGSGAFGEVSRVVDRETGMYYAMKKLHLPADMQDSPRIYNEIAIMQLLQHPFICGLVEAIAEGPFIYLVLRLLKGGDLGMHLKEKGNLSLEQTRFYSAQILLGLEHLHANSILYRDLKPANIVLDDATHGNAVLTDLGIATVGSVSSTFCGTPYYLAPEVIQYHAYGQAVDWWALGIVIYELLVGQTPFAAEEQHVTFQMIEMKAPTYPSGFCPSAKNLVAKLLRKKPGDRLVSPNKIKQHPFFRKINFAKLLAGQVTPPEIVPLSAFDSNNNNNNCNETMYEMLGRSSAGLPAGENPIDSVFGRSQTSQVTAPPAATFDEATPHATMSSRGHTHSILLNDTRTTFPKGGNVDPGISVEMSVVSPSALPE